MFHSANLTLSLDVDQDTQMFGLHERPLTSTIKALNTTIVVVFCNNFLRFSSIRHAIGKTSHAQSGNFFQPIKINFTTLVEGHPRIICTKLF